MTTHALLLLLTTSLTACTGTSDDATTGDTATEDTSGEDSAGEDTSGEDSAEPAVVHELDVDTLAGWLEEEAAGTRELLLINTHIPYAGDIPGTDVDIAYTDEAGLIAEIGDDLDRLTVVYCRSGSMSATASAALVGEGYREIYDLQGGMNAWTAAGYTLEE